VEFRKVNDKIRCLKCGAGMDSSTALGDFCQKCLLEAGNALPDDNVGMGNGGSANPNLSLDEIKKRLFRRISG
jgi:hypothetical protein